MPAKVPSPARALCRPPTVGAAYFALLSLGALAVTLGDDRVQGVAAPAVRRLIATRFRGEVIDAALLSLAPRVAVAAVTLGVLNTFLAYLIFYSIIATLGASRASMVTYAIPAVGLALGTVFLAEPFDLQLLGGAVMIVGSIGVVNLRP